MSDTDRVLSSFTQEIREERVYSDRKLRVGIIGTGWIAEAHTESYLKQPDVEIVAMADLIPGKAEKFAARYGVTGCNLYPDHKSMLDNEKLDAVSVCTYNTQHAVCTIDALKAGVNVLLEKPMTATVEGGGHHPRGEGQRQAAVHRLSAAHGRQHEADQKIVIRRPGKIYYIQTGGGAGIPTAPSLKRPQASAPWVTLDAIPDMVLNAGLSRPLTPGYTSNFLAPPLSTKSPRTPRALMWMIAAPLSAWARAGVGLPHFLGHAPGHPRGHRDAGHQGALRIPSTECWNGSVGGPMTLYYDLAGEQVETVIPILDEDESGLFDKKIRSFLDAIIFKLPPPVPSNQILYNQAIINAIADSAALGREVEVKIPEV